MARPLARQGYTDEDVATLLRTSGLRHGMRYDLLAADGTEIDHLRTVQRGTTIDINVDRKIKMSMRLRMYPDERLRDESFQHLIRPVYLLKPPGGAAPLEFPQGLYPWTIPGRELRPEAWNVTLPDVTALLEEDGPELGGFTVPAGWRHTDAIKNALTAAGITDTSGVHESDQLLASTLSWGLTHTVAAFGFWFMRTEEQGQGHQRAVTWLDILTELNAGLSYHSPWMDLDGRIRATPMRDLRTVTPDATFPSGRDGVRMRDVTTSADLARLANRVYCWTENTQALALIGVADANKLYPGHPFSQAKIRRFITKPVTVSSADDQTKLQGRAEAELGRSLSYHQTVEYEVMAWPVLEAFDITGVQVDRDPDLDELRLLHLRALSFNTAAGKMRHTGRRLYQPVEIVADVGDEETATTTPETL